MEQDHATVAAAGFPVVGEQPKPLTVAEQLERLNNRQQELDHLFAQLADRLGPVLLPDEPDAMAIAHLVTMPASPIAESLDSLEVQMARLAQRVLYVTNRVNL